jgi:hypothetical protein
MIFAQRQMRNFYHGENKLYLEDIKPVLIEYTM